MSTTARFIMPAVSHHVTQRGKRPKPMFFREGGPRAAQPSTLPHPALQDEQLLPKGQNLAVTVVTEQAGEQGSKGRVQYQEQMPEHVGRMSGLDGEVNS